MKSQYFAMKRAGPGKWDEYRIPLLGPPIFEPKAGAIMLIKGEEWRLLCSAVAFEDRFWDGATVEVEVTRYYFEPVNNPDDFPEDFDLSPEEAEAFEQQERERKAGLHG